MKHTCVVVDENVNANRISTASQIQTEEEREKQTDRQRDKDRWEKESERMEQAQKHSKTQAIELSSREEKKFVVYLCHMEIGCVQISINYRDFKFF